MICEHCSPCAMMLVMSITLNMRQCNHALKMKTKMARHLLHQFIDLEWHSNHSPRSRPRHPPEKPHHHINHTHLARPAVSLQCLQVWLLDMNPKKCLIFMTEM